MNGRASLHLKPGPRRRSNCDMETFTRKYSQHDQRQLCFNEALTNFLICDCISPEILEGEGFQRLIEELDPKLRIPISDMKKKVLGVEFQIQKRVEALLQEAREKALSVGVLQKSLQSHIGAQEEVALGLQFIDTDFRLKSLSLRSHFKTDFDFNEEVNQLELPDDCLIFGGDQFDPRWMIPNLKGIFEESLRVACGHKVLDGAMAKGQDLIKNLTLKNNVQAHVGLQCHKMGIKCPVFNNISDQDDHVLIMSTFVALEGPLKVLEMYEEVHPLVPCPAEWSCLKRIANVYKEFMKLLSGWEAWRMLTTHKVIPEVYDLSAKLQRQLVEIQGDNNPCVDVLQALLDTLNCLLPRCGSKVPVLAIGNLLDPRFHGVHLEHHDCFDATRSILEAECANARNLKAPSSSALDLHSPSSPSEILVKRLKREPETADICLQAEMDRYLALPVLKCSSTDLDILKFWRQNEIILPNLARMARKFLVVPVIPVTHLTAEQQTPNFSTMNFIKSNFQSLQCDERVVTAEPANEEISTQPEIDKESIASLELL
ncbi:hypothetical protein TCAL_17142 [Tigriopus californicus]|uniref:HAT C-terminal dimerisation domain-containing protein n=1 Tax=Tigriopus californicus TaxID=6832 RepID=A0A553P2S8_TIGCA|nr:hypothetical protein TCAL_17142 [Tigriopus californicus]